MQLWRRGRRIWQSGFGRHWISACAGTTGGRPGRLWISACTWQTGTRRQMSVSWLKSSLYFLNFLACIQVGKIFFPVDVVMGHKMVYKKIFLKMHLEHFCHSPDFPHPPPIGLTVPRCSKSSRIFPASYPSQNQITLQKLQTVYTETTFFKK